jgi:hypothetical protein
MTTPTSSVNNRSRHETIISQTSSEASLYRTLYTGFTASIVSFIQAIRYIVLNIQVSKKSLKIQQNQ